MPEYDPLLAVSPLDGRYDGRTEPLAEIVSEFGLIRYRLAVEVGWLNMLTSGVLPDVEPVDATERERLTSDVLDGFDINRAKSIKEIEKTTNHDVKAVELWLRQQLSGSRWNEHLELIHFGCTSEDINNLAYAMMIRDVRDKVLLPNLEDIETDLSQKAVDNADIPLLALTHVQPATPTTVGKEMVVFADRVSRHIGRLGSIAILGKFNGASGNYNAASFAYPEVDWQTVSQQFVESLGFEFNGVTTQIEPHDWMAAFFNEVALGNTILTDLSQDMRLYIGRGVFKLKVVEGEVGSSTMPHKVNPIDFENAEGNFALANDTLTGLAARLSISMFQRDLRDSTAQRAIGEAFGHTLVAHSSLKKGLGKVTPDEKKIAGEVNEQWPVLTEAVQTLMRRYRVSNAYELIKKAVRGTEMTHADYVTLCQSLTGIPDEDYIRLERLRPEKYIGLAAEIARE